MRKNELMMMMNRNLHSFISCDCTWYLLVLLFSVNSVNSVESRMKTFWVFCNMIWYGNNDLRRWSSLRNEVFILCKKRNLMSITWLLIHVLYFVNIGHQIGNITWWNPNSDDALINQAPPNNYERSHAEVTAVDESSHLL